MGETSSQIVEEIAQARSRLAQDLNQLEYRVRRSANWRVQYDRHPWAFLGTAFALSALIGMMATRRAA